MFRVSESVLVSFESACDVVCVSLSLHGLFVSTSSERMGEPFPEPAVWLNARLIIIDAGFIRLGTDGASAPRGDKREG